MNLRDAARADFAAILRLNAQSEAVLSPLDGSRLEALAAQAAYLRVSVSEGDVTAFLLALAPGADYASENYAWFSRNCGNFLYVDRVVVDARRQGKGLGRALYEDLFAFARERGFARVTCEFDVDPPNPASAAFHARFGFREIGTQWVHGGKKRVSLQEAALRSGGDRL